MVSWASAVWVDDAWMEPDNQADWFLGWRMWREVFTGTLHTSSYIIPPQNVPRDPPPKTMEFFSERISSSGWENWNMRRGSCVPGGACTWRTVLTVTTIKLLCIAVRCCYNHQLCRYQLWVFDQWNWLKLSIIIKRLLLLVTIVILSPLHGSPQSTCTSQARECSRRPA